MINKNLNYEVEEKYIDNIYGVLYRPKTNKKSPLIIYSHGLGSSHKSGTEYAKYLSEKGYAFFEFDFRNGSRNSKSGNDTTQMSIMTEENDLEQIVNEIKKWDFINKDEIILMGGSQGAIVSALVSGKLKDEIKGLILLYPAFIISDFIHTNIKSKKEIPEVMDYEGWITLGKKYAEDIWDLDFYKETRKFDKEVLIIHGTHDKMVPQTYSLTAQKNYKNSTLKIIEGAGHKFEGKYFEEAIKYIEKYLEKVLVKHQK